MTSNRKPVLIVVCPHWRAHVPFYRVSRRWRSLYTRWPE